MTKAELHNPEPEYTLVMNKEEAQLIYDLVGSTENVSSEELWAAMAREWKLRSFGTVSIKDNGNIQVTYK